VQVQRQSGDEAGKGLATPSVPARDRDGKMGEALAAVISALEKDWLRDQAHPQQENGPALPAASQKQARYFSTLATLKHVRDVLTGRETDFDEAGMKATLAALQESSGAESEGPATLNPKADPKSPTASPATSSSQPAEPRLEPPPETPAASPSVQQHVSTSLPRTSLPRARVPPPAATAPSSSTPAPARSESHPAPQSAARSPSQDLTAQSSRKSDTGGGDPLGVL
jgi:hypothetical protein